MQAVGIGWFQLPDTCGEKRKTPQQTFFWKPGLVRLGSNLLCASSKFALPDLIWRWGHSQETLSLGLHHGVLEMGHLLNPLSALRILGTSGQR